MKKILFKALLLTSLVSSFKSIKAQCSLDQVGSPNFITTSTLSDMVVAPNGMVYTFAYNSSANKFQLHAGMIPSSFTLVATISTSTTVKPAIAISKLGKVSVLIRDENAGKVAKLYYLSGGSLLQQGPSVSTGQVSDLSLTFNAAGEEVVAYTDLANSNIATVKKWNGSTWVNVGTGTVSPGAAAYNSIMVDNSDFPVLAYQDATTAPSNKISVQKYNGASWVSLGVVSTNPATNPKLKAARNSNLYFLGYTEISSSSAIVQAYNGSSWSPLGSPVTNVSSSANTFGLDLDPTDIPAFTTILSTPPYPVAYKYSGGSWIVLVSYINSSTAIASNIGYDATGLPYYFYVDQPNNNALNVKRTTTPVSISPQPSSATVCNGNSGSFFISVGGGSPTYQWQVSSGSGFANANASYTNATTPNLTFIGNPGINQNVVRCVVNAGCVNLVSNSATLTVNTLSVAYTATNPACANTLDGAISATVTGGSTPYSYFWSPIGGSSATATGLYGTTYSLTTSDNIGCSMTKTITLTTPSSVSSSFSGNQTICNGSATTLTVNATGGVAPYTYSWTPSTNIAPTTGSVVTANPTSSITYGVQITDAIGCVYTNTVGVNVNPLPTVSATAGPGTICEGSSSNLNATGSADTYTWMPGSLVGAAAVVSPTTTTTYTVTGTNTVTGCTNTSTTTVTVNPKPTANAGPTGTLTCANTTITLSGSTAGGVTYNWIGSGIVSGGTTLNPVVNSVGTYDLTVTSAAGCSSNMVNTNVIQDITPPSPTAANSGSVTCAAPNSTLTALPVSGVTYLWTGPGITGSTTSQTTTANAAGAYTVMVTNASNGCTNTAVTNVSQNTTPPSPSATNTGPLTCLTTSVNLNGTPATGVTYLWTGPGITGSPTTQNTTANAAGTYTLKTTSAVNGCTNTAVTTVALNNTPPSPTASTTGTITCTTLTVALNGGPGTGVNYLWTGPGVSGSPTTQNTTANAAGVYTLKVTSSINGCTNTAVTNVTQNTTPPSPTASTSGSITCTSPTVTLTGGPGTGVTYLWSGPGVSGSPTTQNTSANTSGTYTLTVTSTANGCTNTAITNVTQNTVPPSPTASSSGGLTCTSLTVALNGGPAAGVTYTWTGPGIISGANAQNAVANAAGNYSLSVTNISNGCMASASTAVTQNTVAPSVTASSSGSITCVTSTVQLTASSVPGGIYNWSGPGFSGGSSVQNPIANAAGIFTVNVQSPINGCIGTSTTTIAQDITTPSANAGMDQTLTCSSPTVTLSGSAVPSSCTPVWTGGVDSGANSYNPTASIAGTYTLTVTDPTNGCSAIDEVQVTANASIPTITVSVSNTLTCLTTSVTTSATTSAALPVYSWSGPGIISGASSANADVNQPGGYTVTVTDVPTGCSSNASIIVSQDITPPVFSVTAVPSTICSGNQTTITASGANTYSWSTGQSTASINDSPVTTTVYSVTGYGTNGCSDVMTETVTVNATPSLSVTGAFNICKGSTTNLTAGGAVSYTWNTGANTASISETPTVTTTYTVTGDNGTCTASITAVVSIVAAKDITGAITSTAGATTGDVILYKYTAALSKWDSVTTVPLGSSYTFTGIDSAEYVIRAMPTATNIQVTYAGSSISWQNATVITHGCTNNSTQNIQLIGLDNIGSGPGELSGTIIEGNGFGHRTSSVYAPLVPGNPIGGIIVKGGKNPGGQMFTQTTTNSSGQYTLTGIPLTTGMEEYFIFVDIPGLDTNLTYHTIITSGNPVITNLDFYVDSMYINPVYVTRVKEENTLFENKVALYPNPANEFFSIQYELMNDTEVNIELYDMLGKKVSTLVPAGKQSKDKYIHRIETDDLKAGVYFVKLKLNGKDTTIKLILTK